MRWWIVILSMLCSAAVQADDLRVGAAQADITPPVGSPLYGQYHERTAQKVHDTLYAKALVLQQGDATVALVACDICEIPAGFIAKMRRTTADATGIAPERVMISATHTHTGPALPGLCLANVHNKDYGPAYNRYLDELPAAVARSVRQAQAALAPAKVSVGVGRETSISFNRRFFMKDGTVGWNPGKLNPNIVKPAGPIDPEVIVVYFETLEGRPICTYVNFALHLDTVGGLEISADYPATLAALLGKVKGSDMVTIFGNGCAGNVNHLDVTRATRQNGHGEAERIGTVLAGEVLKTYARLRAVAGGALAATDEIVPLPLAPMDPARLPWAREVIARFDAPNAAPFMDFVTAFKMIDLEACHGRPIDAEVQVFALGDQLAWVALPGEVFVELGLAIKQASPFAHTMVVSLANNSIDYIPDRKAYAEGNYEPTSARCAVGSGEMLVEASVRLLHELHATMTRPTQAQATKRGAKP